MPPFIPSKLEDLDNFPTPTNDYIFHRKSDGSGYDWVADIGGAPSDIHVLTTQSESGLSNEVNLGALGNGFLTNSVSGGEATVGVDTNSYQPLGTILHQADCSTQTSLGDFCQENDAKLYKGTGTSVAEVGAKGDTGATGPAPAGQIFLSAAGGWPSTTSGCASNALMESVTNKVNTWSLDFDPASVEYAEFTVAMPSDWNGGTVTATFYWKANDATTNAVVWCLQGRSFADGSAIDQAFGTVQCATDANASTAYQLRISAATSAITLAGSPAANQLVQFRVYRNATDGSDTLTVDAQLMGIMVSFTRQ